MKELDNVFKVVYDNVSTINEYLKDVQDQLDKDNVDYHLEQINSIHIVEQLKQFTPEQLQYIYQLLNNSSYSTELRIAKRDEYYWDEVNNEVEMIKENVNVN